MAISMTCNRQLQNGKNTNLFLKICKRNYIKQVVFLIGLQGK